MDSHGQLQIFGPADETVSKIADMYRKVIYIKQEDHQLLLRAKSRLEQYIEVNSGFREIRIQLDFNHRQEDQKEWQAEKSELWETGS